MSRKTSFLLKQVFLAFFVTSSNERLRDNKRLRGKEALFFTSRKKVMKGNTFPLSKTTNRNFSEFRDEN
jgi:hypothetical protein